jgi:hypothetical protein
MTPADDWGTTERIALITLLLSSGTVLTTAEWQRIAGFQSWTAAHLCLVRMSRSLPIYRADDFLWRWIDEEK